jgi:uncharacterized glyoxalase superfamily protein PhnB
MNLTPFLLFDGNCTEAMAFSAAGTNNDLLDGSRDVPFGSYSHLADRYGVHWFFRGTRQGTT